MDNKSQENKGFPEDTIEKQAEAASSKSRRPSVRALKEEIAVLKRDLDEARERFLRQAADFDNFRKRKQRESIEWTQNARENLLRELLPVIDDFERVFQNHVSNDDAQWKGMALIYEKLLNVLKNQGLTPMEPVGKPFDPEYHDALITVPRDDVAPGTVVEVHENGYLVNDRVLRHAKVIVSKEMETETDNDKETAETARE